MLVACTSLEASLETDRAPAKGIPFFPSQVCGHRAMLYFVEGPEFTKILEEFSYDAGNRSHQIKTSKLVGQIIR